MDFSSAKVPISRETWAPRSPVKYSGDASPVGPPQHAPPAGSEPYRPPQRAYSSRSPPRGPYEDRARGPPRDEGRRDEAPGSYGGGYQRDQRSDYPAPAARPRHAPVAVPPNNVLGVFGLSVRTRERDLEDEFGRYGDVEKAVIVYDQRSDRSRGFGFVTMRTVEDAQRAIESLNGAMLNGRPVRVDFSATQKAHNPTPGQYKGERRPGYDEPYSRGGGGGYGRDRDDRRPYDGGRDRYDDRDRERSYRRDDDSYRRRDDRRDDRYERKRSVSPAGSHRRARQSPEYESRRPAYRDHDEPVPKGDEGSRY